MSFSGLDAPKEVDSAVAPPAAVEEATVTTDKTAEAHKDVSAEAQTTSSPPSNDSAPAQDAPPVAAPTTSPLVPTTDNTVTAATVPTHATVPTLGDDEDEDSGLPGPPPLTPNMENTVNELRALQLSHEEMENDYIKEWCALKLKYFNKFAPLYTQRKEILCASATEPLPGTTEAPVATCKLPSFWLIGMKNHRTLAEMIRPHDEPVLRYLEDVKTEWLDDLKQTSFKLIFQFANNPYFEHDTLVKTYNLDEEHDILTGVEGTKIKWNDGKDVTKVTVTKKQRNLKTRQTRIVKDTKSVESFFDFFNTTEFPTMDQLDQMDHEEAKTFEMEIETEYEIGIIIRDKIIPRALPWFMGEEEDEVTDEESDEDSDGQDSDDDDDDSDDDSVDDVPPARYSGRGGRRGGR